MRKFVTAIIIIICITAGVMFIKAMFELEEEASDYLESRQDSTAKKPKEQEIKSVNNDKANYNATAIDPAGNNSNTSADDTTRVRALVKKLLDDPDLPENLKREPKLIIGELYEDLFIEVGLTDEEIIKFTDLTVFSSKAASENPENNRTDDEIKELVGELYFDDYKQYNESLEERIMLVKFKYKLESSEIPLVANQQQQLLDLMLEDCELECNKKILENSAGFLDTEQIEVLEKILAQSSDN